MMPRRLLIIAAISDALSLTGLLKRSRNRARGRRVLEDFSTPWQLDIRKGKTGVLYAEESGAQKPINWAFLSCGRVAHDYANALRCVDGAKPYVVATRSADDLPRAEAFRDRHGFEKAVGTYAEALLDPAVDVVYLSSLHSARIEHVTAILECGKHCVVEKPLACNGADGKRLVELARSKNLFMMEGMWTRCFPAVEHARRLINDGTIGAVTAVISDFGFDAADSGVYPTDMNDPSTGDPIYFEKLGGSALLWAGPYPIAAGLLPFGATEPRSVAAAGVVDPTGVDLSCGLTLSYAAPGGVPVPQKAGTCPPRGATVSLYTAIDAESAETTTYIGQKGRITVLPPAHCPTKLRVELKGKGRGNARVTEFEFPFPDPKRPFAPVPGGGEDDVFFYPNSHGFAYEAAAVTRCLNAGLTECPQYTLDETLRALSLVDAARKAMSEPNSES